jgi:hypothetical protein
MNMVSHRKIGKIEISLSTEGGLRFKRKPSAFNGLGALLRASPQALLLAGTPWRRSSLAFGMSDPCSFDCFGQ